MFDFIVRLWRRWRYKTEQPLPPPLPLALVQATPTVDIDTDEDDTDPFKLDFSLRKNVLDDLDMHFKVLHRIKQADRSAFDLYSQIGCYLIPAESIAHGGTVSPWFNNTRPSFGAVSIINSKEHARSDKRDRILPRMCYFTKYKPAKAPPDIERTNHGDVYVLTLYYDDLKNGGIRLPAAFPIALLPDGTIHPLRQLSRDKQTIRHKRNGSKQRRGEQFSIPTSRWSIPGFWKEQAVDSESSNEIEHLISLFVIAANFYEVAAIGGMTRVDVGKGNLHLILNVDPKYSARFFNDRDKTRLPNGSTKRIFHIVRPHRRIANGKEKYIRFHFRGERCFDWNGYRVEITVPFYKGWAGIAEANMSASDYGIDEKLPADALDTAELGHRLRQLAGGTYNSAR